MSWIQLELSVAADTLEQLEEILNAHGALSISLASDTHERVLEPKPGETPLWSSIRLKALFATTADFHTLRAALGQHQFAWDVQFVGEQDWQAHARTFAVNEVFADRLHLRPLLIDEDSVDLNPSNLDPSAGLVPLYLEPGLAFGSGSHPTTRMCLTWLAEHVVVGQRVLDFGCGSGVLAVAASLLGGISHAVDHDAQAVLATRENAANNGITETQLTTWGLSQWHPAKVDKFDVLVANILAGPLISLAGDFQSTMKSGASIVLSGVLTEQAADVMAAYTKVRFAAPIEDEGWVCLVGTLDG